jgi:hypothetical protein
MTRKLMDQAQGKTPPDAAAAGAPPDTGTQPPPAGETRWACAEQTRAFL